MKTHKEGFFIIKPTRCTNFPNLLRHETLHVSGSSSAHHQEFIYCTLGTGMSYKFVDSFRAGPSWSCSKAVYKLVWHIPVPSLQRINSWWWAEELPETCRVSCRSKFGKLVHQVGFIIKKFVNDERSHELKNTHKERYMLHCSYSCSTDSRLTSFKTESVTYFD